MGCTGPNAPLFARDRQDDHRADGCDRDRADDIRSAAQPGDREDQAADQRTDHPQQSFADQPTALSAVAHDRRRDPAGDQTNHHPADDGRQFDVEVAKRRFEEVSKHSQTLSEAGV